MRDGDGTLVFVEVRRASRARPWRCRRQHRQRQTARLVLCGDGTYLQRLRTLPPCRFDVVTLEGGRVEWLRAAFDGDA